MINLELLAQHEIDRNGMTVYLKYNKPVMMTPKLVDEIRALQDYLAEKYINRPFDNYYVIWYLHNNKPFSCCDLDFRFIHDCFKYHKEKEIEHYIDRIFNLIFLNYIGLGLPIINCSILKGYLSGLSREFFLMSKVCFIFQRKREGISKIDLFGEIKNLNFKKNVYNKNDYYFYNPTHIEKMKQIIVNTDYRIPDNLDINAVRAEFNLIKELTLLKLYGLASRDINSLNQLAHRAISSHGY